jgi:hypothetical protein
MGRAVSADVEARCRESEAVLATTEAKAADEPSVPSTSGPHRPDRGDPAWIALA